MTLTDQVKWEHCLENSIRKTVIGFCAAVPTWFLFPRSKLTLLFTGLTAGIGLGMGYTECRFAFEKDTYLDTYTKISQKQLNETRQKIADFAEKNEHI